MQYQHNTEAVGHAIAAVPAPRPRFRHLALRLFWVIGTWLERSRQRRTLADLDDWLLKDIGLTRSEAVRESVIPFWR